MNAGNQNLKKPCTRQIVRWITEQATALDDGVALLDGFCRALVDAGLPLWRMSVVVPAIDPSVRGFSFDWRSDRGASLVSAAYDDEGISGFERSPLYVLLAEGRTFARWRLRDGLDAAKAVPALLELRAEGGTDYVLHLIWFAPGTALKGVAVSFTLHETLATYLGSETSTRVLNGRIRRGEGETVAAAILLADFRAFTALTDRDDSVKVGGWLDEHFDAIGELVTRSGGEILKFMGDGFLAIFPVLDPEDLPCATCGSALEAAERALALNRALND